MSFEAYRDRELRFYQDRVTQLQHQNRALKSQSYQQLPNQHSISYDHIPHYHHRASQPLSNSILELSAKNQRLQRQAQLYQRQIKRQLTDFIRESNILHQCSFKKKYINALTYPPIKHSSLRR